MSLIQQLQQTTSKAITKQYGSSYYLATLFFPKRLQQDVFELYKFVRIPDEIVDVNINDHEHRSAHYQQANTQLKKLQIHRQTCYKTNKKNDPLFGPSIEIFIKYSIPTEYAHAFFEAMIMDTYLHRYPDYTTLQQYMHGSAEVVWLMMCHLIGFDQEALPYARKLGEAMQLTNFLRDIKEDYLELGRIYMPANELAEYNLTHQDIINYCTGEATIDERFRNFMKTYCQRCHRLYAESLPWLRWLNKKWRKAVYLAAKLYEWIVSKIEQHNYNVFDTTMKTSKRHKIIILLQHTMTNNRGRLLQHSRPRFWMYVWWTYLIGIIAGIVKSWAIEWTTIITYSVYCILLSLIYGFYFLFPANLLIYGVNDIADSDTDTHNDKKNQYEHRLSRSFSHTVRNSIMRTNLPFLLFTIIMLIAIWWPQRWGISLSLFAFLISSLFYSLPPIRAKAYPFIDGLFNILYIIPWILAYFVVHPYGTINWTIIFAWLCRAMAMHAYSAIPDIDADKQAWLTTTAVLLGKKMTIYYCMILFTSGWFVAGSNFGRWFIALWFAYGIYCLCALLTNNIFRYYKYFPYINGLVWWWLFWWIIFFL